MTDGESLRCRARSCWLISKVDRLFLIVDPGFPESVISPAIFSASSVRIEDRRRGTAERVFDTSVLPMRKSALSEAALTSWAERPHARSPPPRGSSPTSGERNKPSCRGAPRPLHIRRAPVAAPFFTCRGIQQPRHSHY